MSLAKFKHLDSVASEKAMNSSSSISINRDEEELLQSLQAREADRYPKKPYRKRGDRDLTWIGALLVLIIMISIIWFGIL